MTLLPDHASFHEKVEACFVAFRRRGVSLSPRDLDLLDAWAAHEVPFEVVARGIRKAAETQLWDAVAGETGPDSLRSCRREVEAEIKKYLRETAGRGNTEVAAEGDFLLTRHRKLKASLRALVPDAGWVERLAPPASFEASERQEASAVLALLRALPWPRRIAILREARSLVENAPLFSAAARQESLRFHRVALTRHAWSMPGTW